MDSFNTIYFKETASKSVKHKRRSNEDLAGMMIAESIPYETGAYDNAGFFYVCDGVGMERGDVAVNIIHKVIQMPILTIMAKRYDFLNESNEHCRKTQIFNALKEFINSVNNAMLAELENDSLGRACATISIAFVLAGAVYTANLGDSPILLYELNKNGIPLSDPMMMYRQQNGAEDLVHNANYARTDPALKSLSNKLAPNVLGTKIDDNKIAFHHAPLKDYNLLLLGSDGGLCVVPDEDMNAILEDCSIAQNPMESFIEDLYTEVEQKHESATDNFTVIAQKIECF